MGQFALSVTSTSPVAPVYVYRGSEVGHIRSISCGFVLVGYPEPAAWVEVGTMIGGRGEAYVVAVLCSGYIWKDDKAMWVGDYPLSPSEEIYVKALSFSSVDLRICGKIEKGDC